MKKWISLFLSMLMILSALPLQILAEESVSEELTKQVITDADSESSSDLPVSVDGSAPSDPKPESDETVDSATGTEDVTDSSTVDVPSEEPASVEENTTEGEILPEPNQLPEADVEMSVNDTLSDTLNDAKQQISIRLKVEQASELLLSITGGVDVVFASEQDDTKLKLSGLSDENEDWVETTAHFFAVSGTYYITIALQEGESEATFIWAVSTVQNTPSDTDPMISDEDQLSEEMKEEESSPESESKPDNLTPTETYTDSLLDDKDPETDSDSSDVVDSVQSEEPEQSSNESAELLDIELSKAGDNADVRYSHTPNIDDEGNADGCYPAFYSNTDLITIPNAKKLRVTLKYFTARSHDYVVVWEGDRADYVNSNDESNINLSVSGKLYGGNENLITKEYIIPGDTVTIYFDCNAYTKDAYGYYAVIEAAEYYSDDDLPPAWHLEPKSDGSYAVVFDEGGVIQSFLHHPRVIEQLGDKKDKVSEIRLHPDTVAIEKGVYAFKGWNSIKTITIPEDSQLSSIEKGAFQNCKGLNKFVYEGGDQLSIGEYAFSGCSSLKSVELSLNEVTFGNHAFENSGLESLNIDAECNVNINEYAFNECTSLVNADLGNNVSDIKNNAFLNCKNLEHILFDGTLSNIGNSAFYKCSSLLEFTIPDSVVKLGDSALSSCDSLLTIHIGKGLESIGNYSYSDIAYGCKKLRAINVDPNNSFFSSDDGVLYSKDYSELLRFPGGKAGHYSILDGTVKIKSYSFRDCVMLESISIPDSFQYPNADYNDGTIFYYCTKLKKVTIGNSAFRINKYYPFYECNTIEDLTVGNGLLGIGENAFKGSKIKRIQLKLNDNTVISKNAFADCDAMEEILLEDGRTIILPDESSVPNNEITIERYLSDASETGAIIDDGAFRNDKAVRVITIPDGVIRIGDYAFQNCEKVTEVQIPEAVQSLGTGVFMNCFKLADVNGKTKLSEAIAMWKNAGADSSTFHNTALEQDSYQIVTEKITEKDSEGRIIELTTVPASSTQPLYTGEKATSTLKIDKGDKDSDRVVRLYFQFEDEFGSIGFKEGNWVFDGVSANVFKSSSPNTYYIEIPPLAAGQTLNLSTQSIYENIKSAGGTALIWISLLTLSEAESLGKGVSTPSKAHLVKWITKRNDYPVSKTVNTNYSVSLQGDGTEDGYLSVTNLTYSIALAREGDALEVGKDHLTRVVFKDTLSFPNGSPLHWREDIIDAINSGDYYTLQNDSSIYLKIGKEVIELASLGYWDSNIDIWAETQGKSVSICWERKNSSANSSDFPSYQTQITFGSGVIVADSKEVFNQVSESQGPVTYTIQNTVTATEYYMHSEPQIQQASAEASISVGNSSFSIEKGPGYYRTAYMGDDVSFDISLKNQTALPYTEIEFLDDPLSDYCYIRPELMEKMFFEEQYHGTLSILIKDCALYPGIAHTVIGTDGNEHVISQDYEGMQHSSDPDENTPYHDKAYSDPYAQIGNNLLLEYAEDGRNLLLSKVTIQQISYGNWQESRYDVVSKEPICTIAPGEIKRALDEVGLLVLEPTRYICRWSNIGTLYSGANYSYNVYTTIKDTFKRLTGDQDWYITEGPKYSEWFYNYAYAYFRLEGSSDLGRDYDSESLYEIKKDFTLDKEGYLDGELFGRNTMVKEGDIVTYQSAISNHAFRNSVDRSELYDVLPLVDRMRGAQALLVSAEDNASLSQFEVIRYQNKDYYLLNQPGEYRRVYIDGYLADRVVVTKESTGLDTMIYWYLSDIDKSSFILISYPSYVTIDKIGLTDVSNTFELSNEIWLNDHQSHRLYDRAFVFGTILKMNKNIVTNVGEEGIKADHTPQLDELSTRTPVHKGEAITYRLLLQSTGDYSVTVPGSAIYDELPESLNNYWSKDNVRICYIKASGSVEISDESSEAWYIEAHPTIQNKQCIRWNDSFNVKLDDGIVYIYVTLYFPDGDTWESYAHQYADMTLTNTYHVYQLQDEVFHDISIPAEALIQKGVYRIGWITPCSDGSNDYKLHWKHDTNALRYYSNDAANFGLVEYYCTIYNSGETRLYLSEIQDCLPRGFSLYSVGLTSNNAYNQPVGTIVYDFDMIQYRECICTEVLDNNVSKVEYVSSHISASTKMLDNGRQLITFSVGKSTSGYYTKELSFDENNGKYYLKQGQALTFSYSCRTNQYQDSEDVANNMITMPYYDYNGAGAVLDADSTVSRNKSLYSTVADAQDNDGNRSLMTNGQVDLNGIDTTSYNNTTQWLTSCVEVYRTKIQPGITKSVKEPFANVQDTVNWKVRVENSGNDLIRAYTFTDSMMAPYQFAGDLSIEIQIDDWGYEWKGKILRIEDRAPGDAVVNVIENSGYVGSTTKQIEINGDPVPISFYLGCYSPNSTYTLSSFYGGYSSADVTVLVSIKRDSNTDSETISIEFPETDPPVTALPRGSHVTFDINTKNYSGRYTNSTYVNTAYFTPQKSQPFDGSQVSQGNYTLYNDTPSVVSQAVVNVSYGYATSSEKIVVENDNIANHASSLDSKNSIVIPSKDSQFRYSLKVNNTSGTDMESKAMDQLILIDNLPEPGDHATFYETIYRYSDFRVNFAEDPQFQLKVNDTPLETDQYTIQLSTKTAFDENDWNGTSTEGWYTLEQIQTDSSLNLSDMRSCRFIVLDDTGTLIPAEAIIKGEFNACVVGDPDQSQVAWNSFGYHYSLIDDFYELEAAPEKVGVKMPSIPQLVKKLVDVNGNPYAAESNMDLSYVIYQGSAATIPDLKDLESIQTMLAGKEFLVVSLTVPKGQSESDNLTLRDQHKWIIDGSDFKETDEPWIWDNLADYTIVELPNTYRNYHFGTFNSAYPNNYAFHYDNSRALTLSCENERNSWNLQVIKKSSYDQTLLAGAVFALYSLNMTDGMSDEQYRELTELIGNDVEKSVFTEHRTWYLSDYLTTDGTGSVEWKGLTLPGYYVLEVKAPENYRMSQTPGQVVENDALGTTKQISIVFENTPFTQLQIGKKVDGDETIPDRTFFFAIHVEQQVTRDYEQGEPETIMQPLTGSFAAVWKDSKGEIVKDSADQVTFDENGDARVELKAEQTVLLEELPAGITYRVTETDLPMYFTAEQETFEGTLNPENPKAEHEFLNHYHMPFYELPSGGGSGTYLFTVFGVAMLAVVPMILWINKRRKKGTKAPVE